MPYWGNLVCLGTDLGDWSSQISAKSALCLSVSKSAPGQGLEPLLPHTLSHSACSALRPGASSLGSSGRYFTCKAFLLIHYRSFKTLSWKRNLVSCFSICDRQCPRTCRPWILLPGSKDRIQSITSFLGLSKQVQTKRNVINCL